MSNVVLKVENISKQYRLGQLGTGTISHDLNRWFHKVRGKEDPYLKLGAINDRSVADGSDYVWSLKDINFEVKQGEVLGIIGKNGAGKSTLLKILSQVTAPTTGKIKVKGRIAALLEVGTGFHPELTGRENIFLNGAILGMTKSEIKSKFDEIVEFSGVAKYLDTPVKRYSSGMMVRLGFAVAAHLEPEILIVDEVLAVGDAEFQKKCLGKMKQVSGEGRTVLFVSHNMLAVKSLCHQGLWLDKGIVKMQGLIENTIDEYLGNSGSVVESFIEIEKESDGFTVHSISASNNGINGNFNIEDDLTFEISVSSNKNFELININLFFNTVEDVLIFATCSTAEKFSKGKTIYSCTIPKNTLNDNIYSIDLMVVVNGEKALINIKDVVTIIGIEQKREGTWLQKYPGIIRPQYFNWKKINIYE
jgi:lipopolysaccharide transport system ATP-binding protein